MSGDKYIQPKNTVIYLFSSENAGKMFVRYFVAMKREKLSLRKGVGVYDVIS